MLRNNADVRRCSYFEIGLPDEAKTAVWEARVLIRHPYADKAIIEISV